MSNIAIKVENLSKAYQIGEFSTGTLSNDIHRWWSIVQGKEDPYLKVGETNVRSIKGESNIVWSLKDINFEIGEGDAVGIIGRNGAGKSTLLKLLSRVTSPTTGSIKVKGRIASLLEVGTGFHPELTGRENIYLNGAILGMRKKEITKKFDEIVAFSGVDRYIDTPVKRYSSGMYVRLAFAVAAHLESEILIVDEVLAVGDAEFQKKCLGKMGDVSKSEGRTVLFVSHNMAAVKTLCNTGMLLINGELNNIGNAINIVKKYYKEGYDQDTKSSIDPYRLTSDENSPIHVTNICLEGHEDLIPKLPLSYIPVILVYLTVKRPIVNANITISLFDSDGTNVGLAFSLDDNYFLNIDEIGNYVLEFSFQHLSLSPNEYSIGLGINQSDKTPAWEVISLFPLFNIENQGNIHYYTSRNWGVNHFINSQWSIKKINNG